MGDIRELKSLQPYLRSSFDAAGPWLKVDNHRLLIVTECKSSVLEIYSVKRDSYWRRSASGRRLRGLADYSV